MHFKAEMVDQLIVGYVSKQQHYVDFYTSYIYKGYVQRLYQNMSIYVKSYHFDSIISNICFSVHVYINSNQHILFLNFQS